MSAIAERRCFGARQAYPNKAERPDLKIAVMSATLEAEPVAEYWGKERTTCRVEAQGRKNHFLTFTTRKCPARSSFKSKLSRRGQGISPNPDDRPVTEQAAEWLNR